MAIHIAEACEVKSLEQDLIDISLDQTDEWKKGIDRLRYNIIREDLESVFPINQPVSIVGAPASPHCPVFAEWCMLS